MEVNEEVARHSQQIKSLEKRMENVEYENKALDRLTVLIENQEKRLDRNEKQFERIANVMNDISSNLTSLNHDMKYIKDQQETMNNRVSDLEREKLKKLEKAHERNVNLKYKVIGGVVISILSAALILWLNLN